MKNQQPISFNTGISSFKLIRLAIIVLSFALTIYAGCKLIEWLNTPDPKEYRHHYKNQGY